LEFAWLDDPHCPAVIIKAQKMISSPYHYQQALIHLDTTIPTTSSTTLQVNALLLKSCILRLSSQTRDALKLVEHALFMANLDNLPKLVCKAQLYRGLCLYELGLFADAGACFTRAAHIDWFARQVTELTALAENKRSALPHGSKGKRLTPGFREIPLPTFAKSFGNSPGGS
jgi:hypothetical protein